MREYIPTILCCCAITIISEYYKHKGRENYKQYKKTQQEIRDIVNKRNVR
jgi:hypothetical protein